ncbi:hypothetical protein GCM10027184_53290 [Saccharothrix stipae]
MADHLANPLGVDPTSVCEQFLPNTIPHEPEHHSIFAVFRAAGHDRHKGAAEEFRQGRPPGFRVQHLEDADEEGDLQWRDGPVDRQIEHHRHVYRHILPVRARHLGSDR